MGATRTDLEALTNRLARALPDAPRFVDTRAMLLSGHATVAGGASETDGFVVRLVHGAQSVVAVVGRPPGEAIRSATTGTTEMTPVLAQAGNANHVAASLPDWRGERMMLHRLDSEPPLPAIEPATSIRLATPDDALDHMPSGLRFEISHAIELAPVAIALVDGRAVSFCYPCWITESLWDVSIDTLAEYRGRHLGAHVVRFMVEHMRPSGRRPVWGALESNTASLRLARRLGFVPIDESIVAFSRGPWAFLTNGYRG